MEKQMRKEQLPKSAKRWLAIVLCMCLVGMMIPITAMADSVPNSIWKDYAAGSFAGGDGTEGDPYQIATAEQLAKLAKDVNAGTNYSGTYFQLTDNIDLSRHRWNPIGIYKWDLYGTTNEYFSGFFDGNNKIISGLIVDERDDKNAAGFFGNIRNTDGSTVGAKDLTISNAHIYASEEDLEELQAGILAGCAIANSGYEIVFENIKVSGTIEIESTYGCNNIGGMIGYGNLIEATNCKAENISISGGSTTGGFIGVDGGSSFENCTVSGSVSGTWTLGGFVGYTQQEGGTPSTFNNCTANVTVNGSDWRLGGFAGHAEDGNFIDCTSNGNVTSTVSGWEPRVGGFIGESGFNDPYDPYFVPTTNNVSCTNCQSTGKVTSSSDYQAGGFVGYYEEGSFESCTFDIGKNAGLAAAGTGTVSSGIEGVYSSAPISSGTHDGIGSVGADALYYDADTDSMSNDVKHITYGDAAYYPLLINRSGDPVTDRRMVEGLKIKAKYTEGEDLIEGEPQLVKVCVDGEYRYFIKFNVKQTLDAQLRDVCGTITLNKSKKGKVEGKDYRVKDLTQDFDFEVGAEYNYADDTYPTVVDDPVMPIWPNEFFILKYDCDEEVEFEFGSDSNEGTFTVDVSGQGKNLITFNTELDENIAAANPDAKMIAISFNNVRFNRTGVFNYEADDMNYAYEIKGGKLVKIAEFANGEVEFNTNTLGRYIFSDVELVSPETIGEAVFVRLT